MPRRAIPIRTQNSASNTRGATLAALRAVYAVRLLAALRAVYVVRLLATPRTVYVVRLLAALRAMYFVWRLAAVTTLRCRLRLWLTMPALLARCQSGQRPVEIPVLLHTLNRPCLATTMCHRCVQTVFWGAQQSSYPFLYRRPLWGTWVWQVSLVAGRAVCDQG